MFSAVPGNESLLGTKLEESKPRLNSELESKFLFNSEFEAIDSLQEPKPEFEDRESLWDTIPRSLSTDALCANSR